MLAKVIADVANGKVWYGFLGYSKFTSNFSRFGDTDRSVKNCELLLFHTTIYITTSRKKTTANIFEL